MEIGLPEFSKLGSPIELIDFRFFLQYTNRVFQQSRPHRSSFYGLQISSRPPEPMNREPGLPAHVHAHVFDIGANVRPNV